MHPYGREAFEGGDCEKDYSWSGSRIFDDVRPVGRKWARRRSNAKHPCEYSRGGSSDSGKCTAELEVDGAAESPSAAYGPGSDGFRSTGGLAAARLHLSDALKRGDFRFTGVDGRGSQNLLRDPRQNRGVAVVRIDDPQGGREGYTFDIGWGGGSGFYRNPSASGPLQHGPYSNGGYGNGGHGNGGHDRDRDGDRDRYNDRNSNGNGSSGWGDNPNSGYGNRAYDGGGWNNGWGNTITYRGQGRGQFAWREAKLPDQRRRCERGPQHRSRAGQPGQRHGPGCAVICRPDPAGYRRHDHRRCSSGWQQSGQCRRGERAHADSDPRQPQGKCDQHGRERGRRRSFPPQLAGLTSSTSPGRPATA